MLAIFWLIDTFIGTYALIIICATVLSWLITFNIVNSDNRLVIIISTFLFSITDPILKYLRRIIPKINGIDLSPIILLLSLKFINVLIQNDIRIALIGY